MIEALRKLICKIFPFMKYEYCFSDREYELQAAFECCDGVDYNGELNCSYCPYYIERQENGY